MILFKRAAELTGWLQNQRSGGKKIGFVPTMGALHSGHISLIDISNNNTDITVCSIFVNPTQFNDPKDFQKYPVTIEKDIYLLEKAGAAVLFLPEADELYPGGTDKLETYTLGSLETLLEGKYRPGHFQGVCQVVRRLLDIVGPDHLFMGQKDYQQCMVIQRLIDLQGYPVLLHPCPIIREPDGLAMSSRNMRLTEDQRKKAPAIYRALTLLKEQTVPHLQVEQGAQGKQEYGKALISRARTLLEENGFRIDYLEIADARTLEPVRDRNLQEKKVALVAAFLGEVRLIDNMNM